VKNNKAIDVFFEEIFNHKKEEFKHELTQKLIDEFGFTRAVAEVMADIRIKELD
jgi:hypothetical protein